MNVTVINNRYNKFLGYLKVLWFKAPEGSDDPFLPVLLIVKAVTADALRVWWTIGATVLSENASVLIHACSWCMKENVEKFPFLMLDCLYLLFSPALISLLPILLFVSVDKGLYINCRCMINYFQVPIYYLKSLMNSVISIQKLFPNHLG